MTDICNRCLKLLDSKVMQLVKKIHLCHETFISYRFTLLNSLEFKFIFSLVSNFFLI